MRRTGSTLAVALILCAVTGCGSSDVAEPAATVTVTATVTATPESAGTVTATPEAAPTVTVTATPEQPGPKESFGPGQWIIGEDIVPGVYRSVKDMPGDGQGCSIMTESGDYSVSERIEEGPIVVRIPKSSMGIILEADEDCPAMVLSP